jgi:hypothetical protein
MGTRLKALCEREGLVYLDYYTQMANAKGGFDPDAGFRRRPPHRKRL